MVWITPPINAVMLRWISCHYCNKLTWQNLNLKNDQMSGKKWKRKTQKNTSYNKHKKLKQKFSN